MVGTGLYEQGDGAGVLGGVWATSSNTLDSGGSIGFSTSPGAAAELSFSGSSIKWVARKAATAGVSDVFVDDVKVATVDLYSAVSQYQQVVFSSSGLVAGPHRIRVVRTGTKNA